MIREIKKDRAGVIPYVLYFIYTVYMVLNGETVQRLHRMK